jgi:spore germination protein YaaH
MRDTRIRYILTSSRHLLRRRGVAYTIASRLLPLVSFLPALALAQLEIRHVGIHQLEAESHRNDTVTVTIDPAAPVPFIARSGGNAESGKYVYGWHPYWAAANAYLSFDYSALTHIAYFSYETDPATGGYTTIRAWNTTPIISYAHQQGVKVTLTVTNFGYDQNDMILGDTLKQDLMITTLISLLASRSGDGVNFDLEMVRNTQRANLVAFMRRAVSRIKTAIPGAEISMATPAVDWSGTWDFAQLGQICDYLIVMGYDYYWSGSSTAGPVAPLGGENYNITRTIDTYLAAGVPPQKLLLGVPWYGNDWPVVSGDRKSAATGTASSRVYSVAEPMAGIYGKIFDATTKVPWFAYLSGTAWRQVWYDDSLSLALKYNLANARALAGVGIWAISHEAGRSEIWSGIKAAFRTTGVEAAAGEVPQSVQLFQNYPNPFNPSTSIGFNVRGQGRSWVRIAVYDLLGREVKLLIDEYKAPGNYTVTFNAGGLASGVYFYRLTATSVTAVPAGGRAGSVEETRKLVLL